MLCTCGEWKFYVSISTSFKKEISVKIKLKILGENHGKINR